MSNPTNEAIQAASNAETIILSNARKELKERLLKRIENDFVYHAPKDDQVERYALIRNKCRELARILIENCPVSRELSTSLSNLEDVCFHANAAIARNE